MKIRIFTVVVLLCGSMSAGAQGEQHEKAFAHLDVAVTAGSTGLGLDLEAPVSDVLRLRTGFAFMPSIHYNMTFGVQVGDDPSTSASKFDRLSSMLSQLTGSKVDDSIDMIGRPTYSNFKLLLDVYPFRKKNWHFTAGFYWGKSEIADAYNTTEDMPSLFAVTMYNSIYDRIENYEPIIEINGTGLYLDPAYEDKILNYGRMGINLGDYVVPDEDGNVRHYIMEPDENSMAKAKVKVNSFKPYLGFGYGGALLKGDDRLKISFDCGAMFWGGTPSVITHDGTDLAKDVTDVRGKVGRYVDIIKGFKVFPVLDLRISYRLF